MKFKFRQRPEAASKAPRTTKPGEIPDAIGGIYLQPPLRRPRKGMHKE